MQKPVNLPASKARVQKPFKQESSQKEVKDSRRLKKSSSTSTFKKSEYEDTFTKNVGSPDPEQDTSSDDGQTYKKANSPEYKDTFHKEEGTSLDKDVGTGSLPEFPPVVVNSLYNLIIYYFKIRNIDYETVL